MREEGGAMLLRDMSDDDIEIAIKVSLVMSAALSSLLAATSARLAELS